MPPIQVVQVSPIQQGALLALLSVKIGSLTIHKCRLIQHAEKPPWVSPPQESWLDAAGQRRYATLLQIPCAWRMPLTHACWSAWQQLKQREEQSR